MSQTKYPTAEEIKAMFKHMETGDFAKTFENVADDVEWTVMGWHPLGGTYNNKHDFLEKTITRLNRIMKPPGMALHVHNVFGGGDQEWACVESVALAETLSGIKYHNTYAWNVRFDANTRKIVQVRAYLDTNLVRHALVEEECPSHRADVAKLKS